MLRVRPLLKTGFKNLENISSQYKVIKDMVIKIYFVQKYNFVV